MATGTPFSQEVLNAREEVVSADLMRVQNLISRDVQNSLGFSSGSIDSANPPTGDGLTVTNGTPISGADQAASLVGVAATFTMTLGPGSGYAYLPAGLTADYSGYQTLRWAQQTLTFTAPAGSDRIDTVVATPATVYTDASSRNILLDPGTRTVGAQSVFKTGNPVSTIAVVAGTPAGSPVPPAVPAGAVALFDVYVPSAATQATQFFVARRLWRRAPFPYSAMAGVLAGFLLKWDLTADPSATSSTMTLASGYHRVAIDGEILDFNGSLDTTNGGIIVDSGASPFSGAAPANSDKPYYIYAVGGRNNPYSIKNGSSFSPFVLVESMIPPNMQTGKPGGTMTTARFGLVQNGATFVGVGFVHKNTTRRKPLIMAGDMVYAGGGGNFEQLSVTRTGASFDAFGTFASVPAGATRAYVNLAIAASATAGVRTATVHGDKGDTTGPPPGATLVGPGMVSVTVPSASNNASGNGQIQWTQGSTPKFWLTNATTNDVVALEILGYKHGVPRLDGCGGL